ncbi:uncharacterized protein [Onthophagus taurus]|uniref:uncharacterized protein n=1 Tax=Onthophagus taurus TaxID=166361 RepID=UPI000C1FFADC|nr:uncharacterized protein LOC111418845 [Onthophagus taurus]
MGSCLKAVKVGFMCRLCSEHKKKVIHLYGVSARKKSLLHKIKLIPLDIQKYDKLPKTVCEMCIIKLEKQYEFVQKILKNMYNQNNETDRQEIIH